MPRRQLLITLTVILLLLALASWAATNALFPSEAAPTGQLTVVPLALNTAAPVKATAIDVAPATEAPSALIIFEIVPAQSQVSFSIFEKLGGQPNTVVGTTSEVAGQLALNAQDLSQTQIGVIQVDARTFVTDNQRRNGAIRNFILNTSQYELITFTPTAITGLSGAAQPGQPFTFQVTGDLTIRDVTHSVTFDVTAQGTSGTQISGSATTIVKRSDFGLQIPSVPNVANVGEEVTLQINFVAEAKN